MQQGVIHIALQSSSFLNLLSTPSSAEDNSKTKNNENQNTQNTTTNGPINGNDKHHEEGK